MCWVSFIPGAFGTRRKVVRARDKDRTDECSSQSFCRRRESAFNEIQGEEMVSGLMQ